VCADQIQVTDKDELPLASGAISAYVRCLSITLIIHSSGLRDLGWLAC
jgi:hypothetical protein